MHKTSNFKSSRTYFSAVYSSKTIQYDFYARQKFFDKEKRVPTTALAGK